ncbi:MAG: hypothetical protein SCH66_04490 [Methanolobus sp.]|nr:hypothetical protein [Methanolobus sp.]
MAPWMVAMLSAPADGIIARRNIKNNKHRLFFGCTESIFIHCMHIIFTQYEKIKENKVLSSKIKPARILIRCVGSGRIA